MAVDVAPALFFLTTVFILIGIVLYLLRSNLKLKLLLVEASGTGENDVSLDEANGISTSYVAMDNSGNSVINTSGDSNSGNVVCEIDIDEEDEADEETQNLLDNPTNVNE